ncbi:aldehyde dehydrogenase family protein [Acinetobacter sp. WZC-1]|uniref:aldehyde dehydrogenase family protein n=1 Tax=Acinetobacter sp. WZC-1 TaxID=3459034 RepID=UPI00403D9140
MSDVYSGFDLQFIAGKWQKGNSNKLIQNINPYTQQEILQIPGASQADIDSVYQGALTAWQSWSRSSVEERKTCCTRLAEVVEQRREEIISWLVKEAGGTRLKARGEVTAVLGIIAEAATYPERIVNTQLKALEPNQQSWVYRQSLGVIAVISPWNYPFYLSMRSVITAIATGNTVVLKPSSDTPITGGLLLGKLLEEAGVPAGVMNVVVGSSSEIGDYFVEHDIPKLVSFTGSTKVGKHIGALAVGGRCIKRVALELGGNAPLVILDDADLDQAVDIAVMGRFLNQGQICMSTNRLIVDASIYDQFVEKLKIKVENLKVGDPSLEDTLVGPIINEQQIKSIHALIEQGKQDGARLIISGETQNNVIPPHVFIDVDPDTSLARNESFGPILPVIKAKDEAHAAILANASEYGLSSGVCTRDHERGIRFALGIDAGMTHINDITVMDHPNAPFGGEKNSGLGRFNGGWLLDEFTRTHWITIQEVPKQYPI